MLERKASAGSNRMEMVLRESRVWRKRVGIECEGMTEFSGRGDSEKVVKLGVKDRGTNREKRLEGTARAGVGLEEMAGERLDCCLPVCN